MANVADLLADLESFRIERTESLADSDKFCKVICAFANDMPVGSEVVIGRNAKNAQVNHRIRADHQGHADGVK